MKDSMVRVKLMKRFKEQKPISYIGKVVQFSEGWIVIDGYMLMLSRAQQNGVLLDKKASRNYIPRDSVESVHVLPNDFDVKTLRFSTNEQQLVIDTGNGQTVFLGELGEG